MTDNDENNYCQHLLLSISQIEHWVTVFILLMKRYSIWTVCQSLRGVFIIRMKTGEIYIAAKWYSKRFTMVGCTPMKTVLSINSFRCYLQTCNWSVPIHWSIGFYYASCLEWIKRGKLFSDVFRCKIYSGSLLA